MKIASLLFSAAMVISTAASANILTWVSGHDTLTAGWSGGTPINGHSAATG